MREVLPAVERKVYIHHSGFNMIDWISRILATTTVRRAHPRTPLIVRAAGRRLNFSPRSVRRVVFSDGSPLPLAQVRPPALPVLGAVFVFLQSLGFCSLCKKSDHRLGALKEASCSLCFPGSFINSFWTAAHSVTSRRYYRSWNCRLLLGLRGCWGRWRSGLLACRAHSCSLSLFLR